MTVLDRRAFLKAAVASALLRAGPSPTSALAAGQPAFRDAPGPPVARVEPVTETFYGTAVTDPYRWMENYEDREWDPYIRGQGAWARRYLDAVPDRTALADRVSNLSGDLEKIRAVQTAGEFVFIEKRPRGANDFRLCVRTGFDGPERVLLDPEWRTQGETHYSIDSWSASPDGRWLACGLSPSGSEDAVIEIMEVASGRILAERIDRTSYFAPSWLPDSSGFFLYRYREGADRRTADATKDCVCWLHRLDTDPNNDVRVLARGQFPELMIHEDEIPLIYASAGSPYVIGVSMPGVPDDYSLYLNTLEGAVAGRGGWKKICGKGDNVRWFDWRGDDIYLLTFKNAPRFRVLNVKASDPSIERAREVVPQSSAVIEDIRAARDALYILDLHDGVQSLRRLGPDQRLSSIQSQSGASVNDLFGDAGHDGVVAGAESWVKPYSVFRTDGSGRVFPTTIAEKAPFDLSAFDSVEVLARARDGTTVPLSIVHRKGTARDGTAPVLLHAYGAYGINPVPAFRPELIALLERGGVWATAHVRGGGERGEQWHESGQLLNKPNTWGDLIACAEYLVAGKWTRPARLGIRGRSAGGVAVGRAMTERPDLFAVVISHVGMNNPLRFEFTPGGPGNVPEFGSLKTEDGFRGLYAMDTTVHVRRGVKYPAVLLTTGMHDPRVEPWEVAKLAAHLQAATASGKPVLLRVDLDAGHGVGSTRRQQDEEFADVLAFFFQQTGSIRRAG